MSHHCTIGGHDHDLNLLAGDWEDPMYECPTTGSRWVEVPEGTKPSGTIRRLSHSETAWKEISGG